MDKESEDIKTRETLTKFKDWMFDQGLKYHPIAYVDEHLINAYMDFVNNKSLF